jgi:Avidin family
VRTTSLYSYLQGSISCLSVTAPAGIEAGERMLAARFSNATSLVSADNKTVTGDVAGTLTGDAIVFAVNWKEEFSSVTAWCGLVLSESDVPAICDPRWSISLRAQ